MTQFEYITVFVSIILALAVAEVLAGLGRLIRERDHVRVYWVHVAWMLLVVLTVVQSWWFAAHPIHDEAVIYISARAHVASAMFMMLSLYFHVRSRQSGRRMFLPLALLMLGLALLSKETALVTPGLILVLELFAGRSGSVRG